MPAATDEDLPQLLMIVEIASVIGTDLREVTETSFQGDRILTDATAYRVGSIGEYVNRLSPALKLRHPGIAWRNIYSMRNTLFHNYDGVLAERVWAVVGQPLTDLVTVCVAELALRGIIPGSPAVSP